MREWLRFPLIWLWIIFGVALLICCPDAKADPNDPSDRVVGYAEANGPAVCVSLDLDPHFTGIIDTGTAIMRDGFSEYETTEILVLSIYQICPRHTGLWQRFFEAHGHEIEHMR